ncbi:MAG: YHS domain-containing (seleno)protein [Thermodesulfobacteriota bacterium]
MFKRMLTVFAVAVFVLSAGVSFAGEMAKGEVFVTEDNVAVKGYDVVSYMNDNKAVQGTKDNWADHDGVTYYFVSEANKDAFVKNPEKYLPQYGGWCAYAVGAAGQKFPVDPETFKVVDGKLYLFFNGDTPEGKPLNTIVPWNADEANLMKQADANWPTVKTQS